MLKQLDDGIWIAEQDFKLGFFNLGNRMTIIRLPNQKIILHSPVRFNKELADAIAALGDIEYILVPNLFHNLFVNDWSRHFNATVFAPEGIEKVDSFKAYDKDWVVSLNEFGGPHLSAVFVDGMPKSKEVVLYHGTSKTLIVTDLFFNLCEPLDFKTRWFTKLYGIHNRFCVTRLMRGLIKDRKAFSESVRSIAAFPCRRVVVSHGDILKIHGQEAVQKALSDWLGDM